MSRLVEPPPSEVALRVMPSGIVEGYASLFGVPDLAGDVVERGAFAASLARRGAAGIRMLWQHDPAQPVGRWLALAEDGRGLRVRGRLSPGVAKAREAAALIADGALDGLSIGFRVVQAARGAGGSRRLLAVDLWEVSLVTFPMLPGARLAARPAIPIPAEQPLAALIRRATRRLSSPATPVAITPRTP